MDIVKIKKEGLLYQQGSKKTEGIVDLSVFADKKRKKPTAVIRKKTVSDIVTIKKIEYQNAEERMESAKATKKAFYSFFDKIIEEKLDTDIITETFFEKKQEKERFNFNIKKPNLSFAVASVLIPAIIFSFSFFQGQIEEKGKVLGVSTEAYDNFRSAAQYASNSDFEMTTESFNSASLNFINAKETIDGLGLGIGKTISELPVDTPISTAKNLTEAGENLSLAGKNIAQLLDKISNRQNEKSLMEALLEINYEIEEVAKYLDSANENIQKVDIKYLPQETQSKIEIAQKTLPIVSANFSKLSEDYVLIQKMLGGKTPQRYLLIFQNNSEIRATGGFIGNYGILDIENGKVKNLFIDNIFNPDGQLKEKVIPPMPIQKISAAWSMHDANWFADFPTSAKKIALFYEKTGGSTVDGVISITPEVIESMLEISGPIEMPEYNTTINSENFVAQTQNQVESLYNKEENKPKKIISDLTPILLEKILNKNSENEEENINNSIKLIQKIEEAFLEKHILIYHRDENVEKMLQKRGWGGEIIETDGDYLSIINSNINGYKTDAVIEENIKLETQVLLDGSIINTVTINRKHNGGESEYDWYNRVNADYMRVYVPKGSILIEAKGNTEEEYVQPMDYSYFATDPDVKSIESTIKIDPESGTQIFEESGKTVFGNWVYVSPKEEVTVIYRYKLPFKMDFKEFTVSADIYKALIQKQSGSEGSNFEFSISFPEKWKTAWKTKAINEQNKLSGVLNSDIKYGIVFSR